MLMERRGEPALRAATTAFVSSGTGPHTTCARDARATARRASTTGMHDRRLRRADRLRVPLCLPLLAGLTLSPRRFLTEAKRFREGGTCRGIGRRHHRIIGA